MERKITEVKESNKSTGTKTKKKVDIQKVAKVIVENKETIAVVASAVGTLINSSNGKKTTTKKKTTTAKKTSATKKKTTAKKNSTKSNDTVSTLVDMFLK